MNLQDVLALARAGFSAQQIVALGGQAVPQVQVQPQVQPQVQAQVQPQVQPQVQAQVQPQVQPQVQAQVQPQVQPQVQNIAPMLSNSQFDVLNNQLGALTNAMQAQAILTSNMPVNNIETTDDILASIINPPLPKGE